MAAKEDQEVKPLAEDDVWSYEKINRIGEGTYGVVYRARHKPTDEIVALKKVRMDRERDGVPVTALRELRILQSIDHPNIVKLKKVVTGNKKDSIFLVFEYCEHDLARLVDTMRTPFSEAESKSLFMQLLQAVEFLHRHRIVHRDLKLSNLLFNNRGQLKLCDFGLARYFQPGNNAAYTPKVVTLWYRAPELLLGETKYSEAVDMWALGCIFGELLKQEPIFPGKVEAHMLELIANLLGSPNERIWPGGLRLPNSSTFKFPHQPYNYVQKQFPKLSASGRDLLNKLLTYDPRKRITAEEALNHPYFLEGPLPKPQDAMPTFPTAHDCGPPGASEAKSAGGAVVGRAIAGSNVDKKLGHAGVGGTIGPSSTQKRKITLRPDRVSSSQAPVTQADRFGAIFGGSSSGAKQSDELARRHDIMLKRAKLK